ncbi:UNVERIFIED_CONTAM: hypothetical protein FKN15_073768 [Acipenser sinensis]
MGLCPVQMEVFRGSARNGGSPVSSVDGSAAVEGAGTAGSALPSSSSAGIAGGQGTVLQFFTKLRRHASLESASPYFKIKKWKFDGNQRASSLDTRGEQLGRERGWGGRGTGKGLKDGEGLGRKRG